MSSSITVGGLASGLDTNSIVDKLVAVESIPINKNNSRQAALNVQISSIGDILTKIKALSTSATNLSKGVAAYSIASTPSGVTASIGTGASAGSYSISVESVATAAKARSTSFGSANSTVAGGDIALTVKGTAYTISIAANSDLGSTVQQINASGAPVRAAVISDGTSFFVSLINRETGKPIGVGAPEGLVVASDASGLGLAVTQNATNAKITVDNDLHVENQTNDISSAIPGVTLNVKAQQLTAADLVINPDSGQTGKNMQSFVDAFNSIAASLKPSLRPDPKNPPTAGTVLDGATAVGVQRQIFSLLSAQASTGGSYHTLADIGLKIQNDGTLTLDSATFNKALNSDPTSVDAIFSSATTGIAAQASALSKRFTDSVDGQLVQRQTSLTKTIKDLQVSNDKLTAYVEAYKTNLQKSFTHMESLIGGYNQIGKFMSASPIFNGKG